MKLIFRTFILLLCLFSGEMVSAQSAWKAFWKLSRPEKGWVLGHLFVAKPAYRITQEAQQLSKTFETDSLLDRDTDGGQVDALRHGYWMARLSQEMSWKKALKLGKAHEKGNYLRFKKRITEDGSNADAVMSSMDLFNNEQGCRMGRLYAHLSPDSLRYYVIKSILEGELRIVSKNKQGFPLDCNGSPLDLNDYRFVWEVPKCLVASNMPRK